MSMRSSIVLCGLAALFASACAEEPAPAMARVHGGVLVTPPVGLSGPDRCAFAVRAVAADHYGCAPAERELHAVGPRAFVTNGCDAMGTFFCDDEAQGALVTERR
jgi:hypothetical protein